MTTFNSNASAELPGTTAYRTTRNRRPRLRPSATTSPDASAHRQPHNRGAAAAQLDWVNGGNHLQPRSPAAPIEISDLLEIEEARSRSAQGARTDGEGAQVPASTTSSLRQGRSEPLRGDEVAPRGLAATRPSRRANASSPGGGQVIERAELDGWSTWRSKGYRGGHADGPGRHLPQAKLASAPAWWKRTTGRQGRGGGPGQVVQVMLMR